MNVDVSPDGRKIAFDLLGDIYTLPIKGGAARRLIGGRTWDTAPRFSPDGRKLVFVRNDPARGDELWLASHDGADLTRLTYGDTTSSCGTELGTPVWSHDGREIAVRWGTSRIGIVDVETGAIDSLSLFPPASKTPEPGTQNTYAPSFSPDGKYVYLNHNDFRYPIGVLARVDRRTGERLVLTGYPDSITLFHEHRPVISRTGEWLAYVRYDQTRRSALRVRNLVTNVDSELLTLPDGDDPYRWGDHDGPRRNFAFTADDRAIIISVSGKLWRVPLNATAVQEIPFKARVSQVIAAPLQKHLRRIGDGSLTIRGIRSPTLSPDSKTLVFTAVGRIWINNLATGQVSRLTDSDQAEHNPAISPDGRFVAYLAYDDLENPGGDLDAGNERTLGRVMLTELRPSEETTNIARASRALTSDLGDYGPPTWFPDGSRVLFSLRGARGTRGLSDKFMSSDTVGAVQQARGDAPLMWSAGVGARRMYRVSGDGNRILAFESSEAESRSTSIVSLNLQTGEKRVRVRFRGGIEAGDISPDGRHAIVTTQNEGRTVLIKIPITTNPAELHALNGLVVQTISAEPTAHVRWNTNSTAIYGLATDLNLFSLTTGTSEPVGMTALKIPRARPTQTLVVKGARIVTMAGQRGRERVVEKGLLVVSNGRIAAVGEEARVAIPEGAQVVDATGMTIIPGLIDVHHHKGVLSSPRPTVDPDEVSSLAYGVTTRYDPSTTSVEADLEHREMIDIGATPGPRYFYSGPALQCYSDRVSTLEDARRLAVRYKRFGVTLIKEFEQPTRLQRQFLVRAAADYGMGITGHVGDLRAALTRVADGFTAFEHSPFVAPIYDDVAKFIALSEVNVTPTIIAAHGIDAEPQGFAFFFREMLAERPQDTLKYYRFREPEYLRMRLGDIRQPQRLTYEQLRLGRSGRSAAGIINAGGTVSIGSHNPPGLFTHWEMWILNRGGASPMDVLRAATINGAQKLGVERDLGTLEEGKLADFIILTANPLDDIRNTTKIRYVVADAIVYDGDTMTRLWPTYEPLPRMGWQTPEQYAGLRHAPPLR